MTLMRNESNPGRPARRCRAFAAASLLFALFAVPGLALAAAIGPVEGGALPGPLPLFPPDNWWNVDVSAAPVDPSSAAFISFIGGRGICTPTSAARCRRAARRSTACRTRWWTAPSRSSRWTSCCYGEPERRRRRSVLSDSRRGHHRSRTGSRAASPGNVDRRGAGPAHADRRPRQQPPLRALQRVLQRRRDGGRRARARSST